ncbi:MAG: hypothetical protein OXF44_07445 [Anaerolineaceae bacterium]|nr:hypothetical protein [Anaerolineaceae bacterium]
MGGRCSGWQQEELIVAAIKSDTSAQHQVFWKEAGHDDEADIRVRTNGETHAIEIKSGQTTRRLLRISGHRLGRYEGDLGAITRYLNGKTANIISVSHAKVDDDEGRKHIYQLRYIDIKRLVSLHPRGWHMEGKRHEQENRFGVVSSLRPSMSWQIWWEIPIEMFRVDKEFVIG